MRDPASSFLLRLLLTLVATALVLGLAYGGTARGGELDHYVPALNNVRDFTLPDKGVYAALYTLYYHSDEFRNRNGNSVDSVRIAGRDVGIDIDLNLYSIVPIVIWSSGFKILGAEYGAYAAIPFGGPSIQAAVTLASDFGVEAKESTFGLQDIGFWTNQFQVSGAYYLNKKATAFVLVGTYEINTEKEGLDLTPRVTLHPRLWGEPVPAAWCQPPRGRPTRLQRLADHRRFRTRRPQP
jgi:hypothetical protein